MYIKRESYLDMIRSVTGMNVIKVLTGMRRVGKSIILKQIQDQLLSDGISQEQIISINFELLEYESIRDYKILNEHINNLMVSTHKYLIFLDEVQEVNGFEKVVNSLHAQGNV